MPIELDRAGILNAERQYNERRLQLAMQTTEQVLEDAVRHDDKELIFSAQLLKAKIYLAEGHFTGQRICYEQARAIVVELLQTPFCRDALHARTEALIVLTHLCILEEDYEAAAFHLKVLENQYSPISADLNIRIKLIYCWLAHERNNLALALKIAKQAQKLIDKTPAQWGDDIRADLLNHLTLIFLKRQDAANTLKYGQPLLVISRQLGDAEKEMTALNSLSVAHAMQAEFADSMKLAVELHEKAHALHADSMAANCLINIGTLYAKLFNYKSALERYQDAYENYLHLLPRKSVVILQNNMGMVHYYEGAHELALAYYRRALETAQQMQFDDMVAHNMAQCTRVLLKLGQYDEASKLIEETTRLFENDKSELRGYQINLCNSAELAILNQQYLQAVELSLKGMLYSHRSDDDDGVIRSYRLLITAYENLKQWHKAYKAQKSLSNILDAFWQMQLSRQMLDIEIRYNIEEKRKQIERLTHQSRLDKKLLEQSKRIEEQNKLLKMANSELEQFAYVVSHDLKQPLRQIGSYTQLINKRLEHLFDADTQVYINYVLGGVKRLSNLLEDLLTYSTLGEKEIKHIHFSSEAVLQAVIDDLKDQLESSGARVTYGRLPIVYAVSSFFFRLLLNLMSNAIKFRKKDVPLLIHVDCREVQGFYQFSISDNGIGMNPESHERVFVIFQRLHKESDYEGTGIGLAICQKIVQLMGGSIWVESEEKVGSTFFFTIPK